MPAAQKWTEEPSVYQRPEEDTKAVAYLKTRAKHARVLNEQWQHMSESIINQCINEIEFDGPNPDALSVAQYARRLAGTILVHGMSVPAPRNAQPKVVCLEHIEHIAKWLLKLRTHQSGQEILTENARVMCYVPYDWIPQTELDAFLFRHMMTTLNTGEIGTHLHSYPNLFEGCHGHWTQWVLSLGAVFDDKRTETLGTNISNIHDVPKALDNEFSIGVPQAVDVLYRGRGLKTILEISRKWHGSRPPATDRYQTAYEWSAVLPDGKTEELFKDSKLSDSSIRKELKDGEIKILTSSAELAAEGNTQKHCVGHGGYAKPCADGTTRIVSFRRNGKILATAEVRIEYNDVKKHHWKILKNAVTPLKLSVGQFKAFQNGSPDGWSQAMFNLWKQHVETTCEFKQDDLRGRAIDKGNKDEIILAWEPYLPKILRGHTPKRFAVELRKFGAGMAVNPAKDDQLDAIDRAIMAA